MKKTITTLLAIFILFTGFAQKQDSSSRARKVRIYKSTVVETNGKLVEGYLSRVTTDSIYIQPFSTSLSQNYVLSPDQVQSMKFKRKGRVGRGALIGLGSGAIFGTVLGFASGDDNPDEYWIFAMTAEEKAAGGAIVYGVLGAAAGTLIGALTKKTFIIEGKREKFQSNYNRLAELAMTK